MRLYTISGGVLQSWCCKRSYGARRRWMLVRWRGRIPSIDITLGLVSWASTLILHHMLSLEAILVVPLCGVPLFLRSANCRWQSPCILSRSRFQPFPPSGDDFQDTNIDMLVAGLRGIEPYGLYQYGSLVERKERHSICCIHCYLYSNLQFTIFSVCSCTKNTFSPLFHLYVCFHDYSEL